MTPWAERTKVPQPYRDRAREIAQSIKDPSVDPSTNIKSRAHSHNKRREEPQGLMDNQPSRSLSSGFSQSPA